MISVRAFVVAVGAVLIVVGAVGLVLDRLRVFESCTTSTNFYGEYQTCTQSPALLIAAIAVMAVGLVAAVGGIVVTGADN